MDICFLETVVAVYRYRSFAEAANERSLALSTVSKHVSSVEKELGIKLFNRATKTSFVTLTEAGNMLMEDIDSYVAEYAGIVKKAQLIKAQTEKQLSIGFLWVAGTLGENKIISEYCKKHPKVRINLVPSTDSGLVKMLSTGRVDGIFTMGQIDEDTKRLVVDDEKLDPERYGFIMTFKSDKMYCGISENSPLAQKPELTLEDLRNETILINNALEKNNFDTLTTRFMRDKLLNCNHQFMDYTLKSVLYDFVAEGNSTILSTTYAGEEHRGVRFVPMKEWDGITKGWFVYRKDIQSDVLRTFRQCAVANCIDTTKGSSSLQAARV